MNFTDIFIRKPVLASVVSLLILVLGVRAYFTLPILQYPRTENAVVTVSTIYYGADPDVVAGFITTPLENAIAQANGIDYMSSASLSGASTITVTLRLNYDADKALTEINTQVASVLNQLPQGTLQPKLTVKIGQTFDAMYIGFNSDTLATNQITDYLTRVVQPKLQAVTGVQTAELLGQKVFALRAWLDPQKLAAFGLTAADVSAALAANDFISGIGTTKGQMVQVNLTASTSLHSAEEFRNLVIKQSGGAIVRLKDIANVTLGAEDYESEVGFDGKRAVYIGIQVAPSANLLDAVAGVHKVFPEIQALLPHGLNGEIVYDSTEFVHSAIYEVIRSLAEALVIVTVVVFLFLGSIRASLIPTIAIPLSLVGTLIVLLALGFSINLLTLLALVLAIGLVVDDAIIVVENISRHLEEGMAPMAASIQAARELGGPIVAMTVVLAAVYVPIGFQGGLTGALFSEFAFALIGAVTISGIVALTLSPMLCSRLLKLPDIEHGGWEARLTGFVDRQFHRLRGGYERRLRGSLNTLAVTLVFAAIVLISNYFLYNSATTELAPTEDQGVLITSSTAAPNSTLQQRQLYSRQIYDVFASHPETEHVFQLDVPGQLLAGMVFKPWDQRSKTTNQLQPVVQQEVSKIAGLRAAVFQPPALPGAFGLPVQFVLVTTDPYERLNTVSQAFLQEAQKSGMFIFLDSDLKFDNPQSNIIIDRDKTAQLGLKMSDVGSSLASLLGGGYVNYFSMSGRSYKVIPQVQQRFRLNPQQLLDYYIRPADGSLVPLSTVARVETKTVPESLNHFQQLNSAMIQGVTMPGVAQGTALQYLQDLAARTLPEGYSVDYAGLSRQYIQESGGFIVTISFAVIMIFLVLAALFESFRDPCIILISVPMSIAGALIFVALGVGSALVLALILGLVIAVALVLGGLFGWVSRRLAGGLGLILIVGVLIAVALVFAGILVPTKIVGALIGLAMQAGTMSLNIYTKVGLVTLIGLISKHGILIVQFANHLQAEQGLSKREAIEQAAGIRLRPILMTTAAMVFGVVPLIIASGAGAVSRFQMGIVIASGLTIGTLFTLFVVPAVYLVIAADHHRTAGEADEVAAPPHAAGA